MFDTATHSRKCSNLQAHARVAVVVGWEDEVTLQCEGDADILTGEERARCLHAYLQQYPDGCQRAEDTDIVLVRIRPEWGRLNDYRPRSFGTDELVLSD